MRSIEFNNSMLKMEFLITDENKIRLLYFGTYEYNWILKDKNNKLCTFIEARLSGQNKYGHNADKYCSTEYGQESKYVSHAFIIEKEKRTLQIVTSDDVLEITTHIQLYDSIKAFSIWNTVQNVSDSYVILNYISSFYLSCFGQNEGRLTEGLNFWKSNNSWNCEAQWQKDSFFHLGMFNANKCNSMKKIEINNTGIWSTKRNLPMCIIENEKEKQTIVGQVENNGSWHIEVGDNENVCYLSMSGPTFNDNYWSTKIEPNEKFQSVAATIALGNDFESSIQEITKARRLIRVKSQDIEKMPIIFNDYMHGLWDHQTTEAILQLVDAAFLVGCDEFCIDAGWFAKGSDWWKILGSWDVYEENFPNGGLKRVVDYIRSKNMKAGIWFELEAMGINCPLLKQFEDDCFFMINNKKIVNNYRYQFDFSNKKVYNWAFDSVCKIIDTYGFEYIKNDCNCDGFIGTEVNTTSLGDGLLKHNRMFVKFLKQLQVKYPNLTIENCGSGGCRMDYELLKICSIQSTSDQTDYRLYPYIASNVLTAVTPEQAAVWSYPVNKNINEPITNEIVAMNMVNSMLGRIHLASYLNELTKEQLDIIKEGMTYYRSIVDFKKNAVPVYPNGISNFYDEDVVGGLIYDKKIILCVWNTSNHMKDIKVNLSKYKIESVSVSYPKSLNTDYKLINNELIYYAKEKYCARVFEVNLK